MIAREIWEIALGELQLQVSKSNYKTLLEKTVGLGFHDNQFVVGVPNTFVAEYLDKNQRSLIERTLSNLTHCNMQATFQVGNMPQSAVMNLSGRLEAPAVAGCPHLNPKYTFDSFVKGNSNELAYTAALNVAQNPGHTYNPLFIYGSAGLGKTHLLHAIGHVAVANYMKVLCVSAEQYTNDFVNAVRERTNDDFRSKYRSVDLLLMDDVHFISGKEQTAESLFHTFNDLHNANHQIAITSDRPPQAIPLLAERLRSRFEWGLTADIQPPDFETRLAILRNKAEQKELLIDPQNLEVIAQYIKQNIRELEGALNRVVAFAQLLKAPITPELTARAIEDIATKAPRGALTPALIIEAVADTFQLTPADLKGKQRDRETALARQVAIFVIKEEIKCSLAKIGEEFGGRTSSTVTHAYQKISNALNDNPYLRDKLQEIQQKLRPGQIARN